MQLYENEQQANDDEYVEILGDVRFKKSADVRKIPVPSSEDTKSSEPCTSTSLRLCNVFFTIPLIAVVIIVAIGVYFLYAPSAT